LGGQQVNATTFARVVVLGEDASEKRTQPTAEEARAMEIKDKAALATEPIAA
jgi:hypothetical protein